MEVPQIQDSSLEVQHFRDPRLEVLKPQELSQQVPQDRDFKLEVQHLQDQSLAVQFLDLCPAVQLPVHLTFPQLDWEIWSVVHQLQDPSLEVPKLQELNLEVPQIQDFSLEVQHLQYTILEVLKLQDPC